MQHEVAALEAAGCIANVFSVQQLAYSKSLPFSALRLTTVGPSKVYERATETDMA